MNQLSETHQRGGEETRRARHRSRKQVVLEMRAEARRRSVLCVAVLGLTPGLREVAAGRWERGDLVGRSGQRQRAEGLLPCVRVGEEGTAFFFFLC